MFPSLSYAILGGFSRFFLLGGFSWVSLSLSPSLSLFLKLKYEEDPGSIPGLGRSPEGNGNPLQYSSQEDPMDIGAP